jgi:hypothetical protein
MEICRFLARYLHSNPNRLFMLVSASPFNSNIGAMKNSGDLEKNINKNKQSNIDESSWVNF